MLAPLHSLPPTRFCETLKHLGIRRVCLRFDAESGRVTASHPELTPLADWLAGNTRDFAEHEAVFLERGERSGALMGAFIHQTLRGQAQGGLRFWPYPVLDQFLSDGLRLAQGMGRKNALAGLWWGGGKGVIVRDPDAPYQDESYRSTLYREYGSFVSSLNGAYITAEDVGTRPSDMASVFATTRFVSCVPAEVGGSGNPSPWTAKGVVCAMQAALEVAGLGTLAGKTVAMQGLGNVGAAMLGELLKSGVAQVVAADISPANVEAARQKFQDSRVALRVAERGDDGILATPCDVLAPNALGGVLNPTTIPKLAAKIVCGAANNQLLDIERDAKLLAERGVWFVPDFVANRMGIVNCANEQYGRLSEDPAILRHFDANAEGSVFQVTKLVLLRARASGQTPSAAANLLADELGQVAHPIWGHRTKHIIDDLVRTGWADAPRLTHDAA